MILKRLREQAGQQNWFGVGVDLAILILGVFLGIQVNNWNQDRLDRKVGADYRQRIVADIQSNDVDLRNRLTYFRDIKSFAAAALEALDRPVEDNPQAFLTNAYQASQISPRRIRRFAYDEAVATGNLIGVGTASTRDRLANYYIGVETIEVTLQNVPPYREQLRAFMPPAAQEAVRTQCPEGLIATEENYVLNTLPKDCVVKLDAADAIRDAKAVRAIPTLRSDLIRLMADVDVKITLAEFLNRGGEGLRKQLAESD